MQPLHPHPAAPEAPAPGVSLAAVPAPRRPGDPAVTPAVTPGRARRARRTAPLRSSLLVVLALLVTVGPASYALGRAAVSVLTERALAGQRPALATDAAPAPLGAPAPAPTGTGGYAYLGIQDDGSGHPVRWDPCRPIHYVVRPDGAPPGGAAAVEAAVDRIEQLTGLRFVSDGGTTEVPRPDRPTMDRPRYGERWSPVLVAWTDPGEYPPMAGYAGLGGPDAVSGGDPGSRRYVTGVVLLNRDHLAEVAAWPQGPERVEAVVLHEFGHLAGLDHVEDEHQLMFRRPTALPGVLGDGDRRGFAGLASGPCFRDF